MYDVSLLVEVNQERDEFELYKVRELAYWTVNIQSTKHIPRDKIMILPSEQKAKQQIDWVKEYEKRYAERQLKKLQESTQNKKWQD